MLLSNFHTHTTFCDGKGTVEEMILEAIRLGLCEIGFSSHSYISDANYTLKKHSTAEYISTVREMADKYKDKIKVYLGIEVDICSDVDLSPYDYVIGSAHYVIKGDQRFDVDHSAERTRYVVENYFDNDPYAYCEEYFDEVSKIYERTHCDIIGHFDLLTKFIEKDPIFSTSHPRYIAARDRALDVLLSTPAVFEVNTGAISRGYRTSPYPEDAVLMRLRESDRSVVVNTDCHSVSGLGCELESSAKRVEALGVNRLYRMEDILNLTRTRRK